jgi:hypothetical protein
MLPVLLQPSKATTGIEVSNLDSKFQFVLKPTCTKPARIDPLEKERRRRLYDKLMKKA